MIIARSKYHTVKYLADNIDLWDTFRVVRYAGFRGERNAIPFWFRVETGNTCRSDLTKSMEELSAMMNSNTRNEIRRAEKEGCKFSVVDNVDEFIPFYNTFAKCKGLGDLVSALKLKCYTEVLITKTTCDDVVLAMHAHVINRSCKQAMLLYSCSERLDAGVDRKLIGWGNRFLHYRELEYLKGIGMEDYDWSGVCVDPDDSRYSIGQFKLSLGGVLVNNYTAKSPVYCCLECIRNLASMMVRVVRR